MSNAALLKVYNGEDPELCFLSAGPTSVPTLAEVLAEGAAGNNVPITALGDLTFGTGDTIQGPPSATFNIQGGLAQNMEVSSAVDLIVGAVGGNLVLDFPAAGGELILTPNVNKLTNAPLNAAANAPTYLGAVKQLKIQIGSPAVDYYIALNPAPFA